MTHHDHILLYDSTDKKQHVKISTYEKWRDEQEKEKIADFIYERHYRRYIKPFEFNDIRYKNEYKNGFAIMANCCLLIETMESFYRGWPKSKNELNFFKFFTRESRFKEFATDVNLPRFNGHQNLTKDEDSGGAGVGAQDCYL